MFLITITTINIISRGEWFIFERKWLGFCFLFSHCFRLLAGLKLELVISVHDDVNVDGREVFSLLHSFIYFVSTYCIWLIRRKSEKQEIFFSSLLINNGDDDDDVYVRKEIQLIIQLSLSSLLVVITLLCTFLRYFFPHYHPDQ